MGNKISKTNREKIFTRHNGLCAICGIELTIDPDKCRENNYIQVDHIIPKHLGGGNDEANLRPLCRLCNSKRKGTTGFELLSFYQRELKNMEYRRNEKLPFYVDNAKNGAITKEQLRVIEKLIQKRRELEDELIEEIKKVFQN